MELEKYTSERISNEIYYRVFLSQYWDRGEITSLTKGETLSIRTNWIEFEIAEPNPEAGKKFRVVVEELK